MSLLMVIKRITLQSVLAEAPFHPVLHLADTILVVEDRFRLVGCPLGLFYWLWLFLACTV